jgi:hypothetical protein
MMKDKTWAIRAARLAMASSPGMYLSEFIRAYLWLIDLSLRRRPFAAIGGSNIEFLGGLGVLAVNNSGDSR